MSFFEYQRRLLLGEDSSSRMEDTYYSAGEQHSQLTRHAQADTSSSSDDSNVAGTILSYVFLFGLIFGLSATVEVKNLKKQLQNKFALSTGVAVQFIIMPVLGFISVTALKNQPGWTKEMGIALLVVTSSPGGSYSNWWCSMFNADLALSVAMTTVSSLLSMAMLPLNLFFYTFLAYGKDGGSVVQALDFGTIFLALGIVLAAISSGLYAGYRYDSKPFHIMANRLGSCCGILLVLFSLFISSGADGAQNSFWNQEWPFYVGVAFPCLVGMLVANFISQSLRLKHPETVAIAIECCYQNTGIATSVAIAMYSDDKELRAQAVAVPLFYGVVEAVAIFVYCLIAWKSGWTKAPASDPLCKVIVNSYEVEDDEQQHLLNNNGDHNNSSSSAVHDSTIMLDDETLTVDGTTATMASQSEDPHGGDGGELVEEVPMMASRKGSPKGSSSRTTAAPVPFWKRWWLASSSSSETSAAASCAKTMETDKTTATTPRQSNRSTSFKKASFATTKPTSKRASFATANKPKPALPALHEDDDGGGSEEFQGVVRDRSFTVDTCTSSGPPTTPMSKRDLALVDRDLESMLPALPDTITTTTTTTTTPIKTRKPPSVPPFQREITEV